MKSFRVGVFCNFYPSVDRLSSTSVGLVHLLSKSSAISQIQVIAPLGSALPSGIDRSKVTLCPIWQFDDPISLVRAFWQIIRIRKQLDILLFNVYLTSFGKSDLANGLGLLLPFFASFLRVRRPVVYMHNFIETQDIEALGYHRSGLGVAIAKGLERLIVHRCELVVPLASQERILERKFGRPMRWGIVPYVEAVPGILLGGIPTSLAHEVEPTKLRVLLFGSWGPQKDAEGIISSLAEIRVEGFPVEIVLAGGVNPNFPEYQARLKSLTSRLDPGSFELKADVPESQVAELFRSCDAIILPYTGSGGYSAVMNLSAYYGLPILAYDIPDLRECAAAIGTSCRFFKTGDMQKLRRNLGDILEAKISGKLAHELGEAALLSSVQAAEALIGISVHSAQRKSPE